MKRYPPKIVHRARRIRIPAFLPVPLRARADGWTTARQIAFIGALGVTGSVLAAARRVAMARESAYRLRRRPGAESFAAAWDATLGKASVKRKVTPEERVRRAREPLFKPVLHAGRHVGTTEKVYDSALLTRVSRLGRAKPAVKSQGFARVRRDYTINFGAGCGGVWDGGGARFSVAGTASIRLSPAP